MLLFLPWTICVVITLFNLYLIIVSKIKDSWSKCWFLIYTNSSKSLFGKCFIHFAQFCLFCLCFTGPANVYSENVLFTAKCLAKKPKLYCYSGVMVVRVTLYIFLSGVPACVCKRSGERFHFFIWHQRANLLCLYWRIFVSANCNVDPAAHRR